jgi:protein involved in polysaccharide export with SLBB domain
MTKTIYSVLLMLVACAPLPAAETPAPPPPEPAPQTTQKQQTVQTPPVTPAPVISVGPREYRVGPGDTLKVDFIGIPADDRQMNRNYLVQSNGTIEILYLESVKVEGLTQLEVGDLLARLLEEKGFYNTGQLQPSVTMAGYRDFEVQVNGAVRTPGLIRLSGENSSVNRAISQAGGWAANAGTEVEIIRAPIAGRPPEPPIVLTREQLDMNDDPGLRENDRVNVRIGQVFFVNGEVNNQGEKRWESGMTVNKALALAGGQTAKFSLGRSRIERPVKDKDGTVLKYEKIGGLKPETLILPDDVLVAGRKWM